MMVNLNTAKALTVALIVQGYSTFATAAPVIGHTDSATAQKDGSVIISGWACDTKINQSINLEAKAQTSATVTAQVSIATGLANLSSEAAVATTCKTSATPHRFKITVNAANALKYAGQNLYIYGISKSGGANLAISRVVTKVLPTVAQINAAKGTTTTPTPAPSPTTPTPTPSPSPVVTVPVAQGTFDATCYLARYADIAAHATFKNNPESHYINHGKKEGRIPGCQIGTDSATSMSVDITPKRFAGSVTSLKWNGREFINIWDHGRQLQSAMQVDGYAECNNPTEAGSEADAKKATSTSVMTGIKFPSKNAMDVDSQMAYWSASRVTGACVKGKDPRVTSPLSNHILSKNVVVGLNGDQQIAKFKVTYKSPRNEVSSLFVYEFLTGYLNSEFIDFYTLSGSTVSKVTKLNDISGSGFPAGSYHAGTTLPVIMSDTAGTYAMGVYFPQSQLKGCATAFHGYNLYRFNLGGSGAAGNATNKWSLAVNENVNSACVIADGSYYNRTFEVYVIVGTLEQVKTKIAALAALIK